MFGGIAQYSTADRQSTGVLRDKQALLSNVCECHPPREGKPSSTIRRPNSQTRIANFSSKTCPNLVPSVWQVMAHTGRQRIQQQRPPCCWQLHRRSPDRQGLVRKGLPCLAQTHLGFKGPSLPCTRVVVVATTDLSRSSSNPPKRMTPTSLARSTTTASSSTLTSHVSTKSSSPSRWYG